MQKILLVAFALLASIHAFGAGKVTGKVTDQKNGLSVIGATITVKGTTIGTVTDMDGFFELAVDAGEYTIEVVYIGYQKKEIDNVVVTKDKVVNLDILLVEATSELKEVVIQSTMKKENISSMIVYQKTTNTVAQVVSAEAIRRSPDRNTGEVLKRVSSASIQEGKYLVVRGLADRYNQATLNGTLLSSTEPDRKTFSFDIFPAGMIENIVINKAATPDLPGEFAGGLIQVNTKDIPTKNFFNIQIGSGFNAQTIGKDFNYYQGGKRDWLGLDDGTRALPSSFPDKVTFRDMSTTNRYAVAKDFKNDWDYSTKQGPLNANLQASGGFNSKLFNKEVGGIFAVNYNKRNNHTYLTRAFFNQSGAVQKTLDFNEESFSEEVLWGALANLSVALDKNNRISFKNLFNVNGLDNTLIRSGRNNDFGGDIRSHQLGFKSTQFFNSQLLGTHYITGPKLKINWNGAYTKLYQNQPNLRRMEYRKSDGDSQYVATVPDFLPSLGSASRFYSNLTDNTVTGGIDAARQFKMFGDNQTVKGGYMMLRKTREFNSRPIGMIGSNAAPRNIPVNELFAPANIGPGLYNVTELTDKDYDYTANSTLNAAFLMLDNTFATKFRLVWGVRFESFNQQLNGFQSNKPVNVDRTVGDFLPSMNLTYKFSDKTNFRFCASQTVIRPEFRELSPFTFYDFELLAAVQGNPELKRTKVTNLDLRYELYPRAGEMVTAGVFFKDFTNTIEQFYNESGVNTFSFTYGNAAKAASYGLELEFRKKLDFLGINAFKPFTAFANASYIANNVKFDAKDINGKEIKLERPMQGQSPYVINSGIQFESEKSGTNATILYNVVGRRIFLVGNEQNPNIWEAPRPLLDFQIAQKIFGDRAEVKFSISDILNRKANFYQDKNEDGKYDPTDFLRISRQNGTNYTLSFMYNLK